jgi:antitoxin (DNA-binding transcriptional repressor) of toxin-antitoxin stability system
MNDVLTIYEAKTNLSKYIKRAEAGEKFYIGAYGKRKVMLSIAPEKQPINIGVWDEKWKSLIDNDELMAPLGDDVWADFDKKEFVL